MQAILRKMQKQCRYHLCLARSLAVAAHDLHPVRGNGCLVVELEGDILDQERPDFVAEPVGVEVTLFSNKESKRSVHLQ